MAFAKKQIDTEKSVVVISFEDGSTHEHDLNGLSPEIVRQLALHGLSQKLGDSYAGAAAAVADGEAENPVAFAREAIGRVWGQLTRGEWSAKREGGSGAIPMLARAVAQVLGISPEEAAGKLEAMDKEQKKKVQASPKVALALAKLKAEAAERAAARAAAAAESAGDDLAGLI